MQFGYGTVFLTGQQFFLASEAPVRQTEFKTMIITFAITCFAQLGIWVYLVWLNKGKERKLRESGGEEVYARNDEFLGLTD